MKVTVDAVVFGYSDNQLQVLLIKRKYDPFKGTLAFPGGYVLEHERARETVIRELKEETNVEVDYLEQLYTFTRVDRDPRGRIITIAYYALVNPSEFELKADTDADSVQWIPVHEALKQTLGFDHNSILNYGLTRLKNKIKYEPIGFDLLPEKFKITDLHRLYETILDTSIDIRNFDKKIKSFKLLIPTKEFSKATTVGRKGRLYKFDRKMYEKMKKSGFLFEIQK